MVTSLDQPPMTTIQAGPSISDGMESFTYTEVTPSALDTLPTIATELELADPGEIPDSEIDSVNTPDVQPTLAASSRPRLKITNPDSPVRYIPIHIWPEYLKKAEPRTGRRYCPKRSRTVQKRNGSSPLVREYSCTDDEGGSGYENQGSSDTETIQSNESQSVDGSTTMPTAKQRGWGRVFLEAMQNAVPKRHREGKRPHFTLPRRSLSLSALRQDYYSPGLKKRGIRESVK